MTDILTQVEPTRPHRDARGRFVRGNGVASDGGRARAAKLTPRRRRQIARKGRAALVRKHFHGDDRAQRHYLAALGAYAYEVAAGAYDPRTPLRPNATHPGPIQDWLAHYWTPGLFTGAHIDIDFQGGDL